MKRLKKWFLEKILGYKPNHYGCLKVQPHKGKCSGAEWADENPDYKIQSFKKGDFIVITSDNGKPIQIPGWKESGLLGGLIITPDEKWEKWTDEDLLKVGLKRI